MIDFCSVYCVNVFWFNIQLAKQSYRRQFLFLCKTLAFLFLPFLNLGAQIRCPQNRYTDLKSALDQPTAGGDTYFICHVTQQDHSVEMPCVLMGESSSPYVTTLKSLVTIVILIIKRKNASLKISYKYILKLKKWVDWITTKREKNVTNTKMVHFEEKCPEIKNIYIFFPLWPPSITLLLKWKPVELKKL